MKHEDILKKVRAFLNSTGRTPEEAATFAAEIQ